MQIVSSGDNLQKMWNMHSWENIISLSSAELAQRVVKVKEICLWELWDHGIACKSYGPIKGSDKKKKKKIVKSNTPFIDRFFVAIVSLLK